jgi:hypothetical protein
MDVKYCIYEEKKQAMLLGGRMKQHKAGLVPKQSDEGPYRRDHQLICCFHRLWHGGRLALSTTEEFARACRATD